MHCYACTAWWTCNRFSYACIANIVLILFIGFWPVRIIINYAFLIKLQTELTNFSKYLYSRSVFRIQANRALNARDGSLHRIYAIYSN